MTFIRLLTIASLLREDDGTTYILLSQEESLRFGNGLAAVLNELSIGISVSEWKQRVETDPVIAQADMTLNEYHLLEQSDTLQPIPLIKPMPSRQVGAVVWWGHVLVLLSIATIGAFVHLLMAAPMIDLLFGWNWLLIPIAILATLMFHESGHYIVARLCGHCAVIKMWQGCTLLPRCVITPNGRLLSMNQKLLILAAGPWADSILLMLATTYTVFVHVNFGVRIAALCALLNLFFSLCPSRYSDFGRILSLAPDQMSGSWVRRMCWVLLPTMIVVTLFDFFSKGLS